MLQLVREYSTEVYLLGETQQFELALINIGVCADAVMDGHDGYTAALEHLNAVFKQFLRFNWQRRWLISSRPEQVYAEHINRKVAVCPMGATPTKIAEYLLSVIEVYLRGSGLLVRDIEVRVGQQARGRATLDAKTAELYESEMGASPDAKGRTSSPFSPRTPIAERGLGKGSRYCALPMPARQ